MSPITTILLTLTTGLFLTPLCPAGDWVNMFDGKTLNGWKVNTENPDSFSVENGAIKIAGRRTHLFYGAKGDAKFKDFEMECEIKTGKSANSGIFFHTTYQERGWPQKGYEAQVNASHGDWRKTGSIYNFKNVKEVSHADDKWFTYNLKVQGKKVTITINGKVVNEYVEPDNHTDKTKRLGEGTIALQAHDLKSVIYFRNLRIRKLN